MINAGFAFPSGLATFLPLAFRLLDLQPMNDQLVKREDVAKRLKLLIKVNNLSNAAFASAANVPRTSLQQALKGTTQSISNEYLARIALRFGVDMDWLLMGREHFLTVPMRRALSEASRALDAEAEASRGRTAE